MLQLYFLTFLQIDLKRMINEISFRIRKIVDQGKVINGIFFKKKKKKIILKFACITRAKVIMLIVS